MKIGDLIRLNDGRKTGTIYLIIKELPEDYRLCKRFKLLYSADSGEAALKEIGASYAKSYFEIVEFEK